ncbi:hypothetical protein C8Q80DRAFT_357876 [Daedaleopsis nitida]|nr:hypothetical protein C8Q80DRAFT_357876 [Daedaleopsis nitida]
MARDIQCGSDLANQSSIADVPVEIFARVFATLSEDRASLFSCSLVSSIWRQVSVPHLFHTIRFHAQDSASFSNLSAFIQNSPHLARYIVVLHIHGPKRPGYRGWMELYANKLSSVTSYLPALTDLSISRVAVVDTSGQKPFPRHLRTLETIALQAEKDSAAADQDELRALSILLRHFYPQRLVVDTSIFINLSLSQGGKPFILSKYLSSPLSAPIHQLRLVRKNHFFTCYRLYHAFFHAILTPDALNSLETGCSDTESIASLYELVSSAGRNLSSMNLNVTHLTPIPRPDGGE